jgi:hypothetical protein
MIKINFLYAIVRILEIIANIELLGIQMKLCVQVIQAQ